VSSATLFNLAVAGFLFGFAWLVYSATRARPTEGARPQPTQTARETDTLRLLQDLDAHLDAYAASLTGLYEQALVPEWEAGRQRLHDAINNDTDTEGGTS
jgi:hypothetical protein